MNKYYDEYLLCKIKYNNYYNLKNTEDRFKNDLIKNLFSFKKINENTFEYDNYTLILYKELINILIKCIELQLKTIYKKITNKDDNVLNIYTNLDIDIKNYLESEKYFDNDLSCYLDMCVNLDNYNLDCTLFYFEYYLDRLDDLLDMLFESEKWYQDRNRYLNSEEGTNLYNLYKKYCLNN